jgi:hypothetical protein
MNWLFGPSRPGPERRWTGWIFLAVVLVAAAGLWWVQHRPTRPAGRGACGGGDPAGRRP